MAEEVVSILCNDKFESCGFLIEYKEKRYLISTAHTFCDWDKEEKKAIKLYPENRFTIKNEEVESEIEFTNSIIKIGYDFGYTNAIFHDYAIIPLENLSDLFFKKIEDDKEKIVSENQTLYTKEPSTLKDQIIEWKASQEPVYFNHEITNGTTSAVNIGQSRGFNKLGYSGSPLYSDKDEIIGMNIMGEEEKEDGKVHYILMEFILEIIDSKYQL